MALLDSVLASTVMVLVMLSGLVVGNVFSPSNITPRATPRAEPIVIDMQAIKSLVCSDLFTIKAQYRDWRPLRKIKVCCPGLPNLSATTKEIREDCVLCM